MPPRKSRKRSGIARKSNPALWEKAKKKACSQGNLCKHSARKMQWAVNWYKRNGGRYIGKKSSSNRLARWGREKWRTSSGKKSHGRRRYLPDKVWKSLSPSQKRQANRTKLSGYKKGKQYVRNPVSVRRVSRVVRRSRRKSPRRSRRKPIRRSRRKSHRRSRRKPVRRSRRKSPRRSRRKPVRRSRRKPVRRSRRKPVRRSRRKSPRRSRRKSPRRSRRKYNYKLDLMDVEDDSPSDLQEGEGAGEGAGESMYSLFKDHDPLLENTYNVIIQAHGGISEEDYIKLYDINTSSLLHRTNRIQTLMKTPYANSILFDIPEDIYIVRYVEWGQLLVLNSNAYAEHLCNNIQVGLDDIESIKQTTYLGPIYATQLFQSHIRSGILGSGILSDGVGSLDYSDQDPNQYVHYPGGKFINLDLTKDDKRFNLQVTVCETGETRIWPNTKLNWVIDHIKQSFPTKRIWVHLLACLNNVPNWLNDPDGLPPNDLLSNMVGTASRMDVQ